MAFNLATVKFFILFYFEILAFLFIIKHSRINKYQKNAKVEMLFDGKIIHNICLDINKYWLH